MQKGFLSSLFDFSFSSLVTTKLIKFLYILSMIIIGLVAIAFVISAFSSSALAGVLTLLILAPLGSLFYLIYVRVILEVVIALFRIMENTQQLVAQGAGGVGAAAPRPVTGSPPPPGVEPGSAPDQSP